MPTTCGGYGEIVVVCISDVGSSSVDVYSNMELDTEIGWSVVATLLIVGLLEMMINLAGDRHGKHR